MGIAPGNSGSAADTLVNVRVTFEQGRTYAAIANGVLDPSAFEGNPDGRSIGFTFFGTDEARESGADAGLVDLAVLHGSTDAPTVDVIARGVGTLVDDAAYGDLTDYFSVPAGAYTLDITPGGDNGTIVASFAADLSGLGGGAAIVFASGFLTPDNDQNGAPFGILAALPTGDVIALPAAPAPAQTARLQVIHNAADPAAAAVDVYLNGGLLLDDFAFRSATPFIDAPANVALNIGVAPGNSTSVDDTLKNFVVTLAPGGTYTAIANGVLDPSAFVANPDGRSTAFTLFLQPVAREAAERSRRVDVYAVHGASDAPAVNILALGLVLPDVRYGDVSGYASLRPTRNWVAVFTPGPHPVIVGIYPIDLRGLAGGAAAVVASGFLSPSDNQNGAPFALIAVLPDGAVLELPNLLTHEPLAAGDAAFQLGIDDILARNGEASGEAVRVIESFGLEQNYPNPFNPTTTISFSLASREDVSLTVYDITGREVATLVNGVRDAGAYSLQFDGSQLASGVYFYRLQAGAFTQIRRMSLVK